MMIDISNLTASVAGQRILTGVDLQIGAGEVHAIMGDRGLANELELDGYGSSTGAQPTEMADPVVATS